MRLDKLYTQYLDSKPNKWSASTLRSEKYRVRKVFSRITSLANADLVWAAALETGIKPYSRGTLWSRLDSFVDWLVGKGHLKTNEIKRFREDNPQLFRNQYERKIPKIGYEEAVRLLDQIPQRSREKARQILRNALRYTESGTLRDGHITGKGAKTRRVFNDREAAPFDLSYSTFVRDLSRVGLKPHDLRKIALAKCRKEGADVFTLKKIAGWSSITTAQSYIEACDEEAEAVASKLR